MSLLVEHSKAKHPVALQCVRFHESPNNNYPETNERIQDCQNL